MYNPEPDHTSLLGRMQLRARRVPVWIRVPVLLFAFFLTFAAMVLDLPPYSLISDAQAGSDGDYYPVASFLITLMCFLVPAGLFIHLLAGAFPDNTPRDPFAGLPVPPPNAGPLPAYMQSGPYAQPLYGAPPQAQGPMTAQGHPQGQGYSGPPGQGYSAPPGQGPSGPPA